MLAHKFSWLLFFVGMMGWTNMIEAAQEIGSIKRIVGRLSASAIGSPTAVEKTFNVKLALVSDRSFRSWSASGFRIGEIDIRDIDYREPKAGSGQQSGPMLSMSIKPSRCITVDDIKAAYPAARITSVPRGSRGERIYLSLNAGGGEVSFGVAADEPECLNIIIFSLNRSP